MLRSMTGFASASGSLPPHAWSWELRAVNGKGQDLRLRVPDWLTGLETILRKKLGTATARGNITLALRISREEFGGTLEVNPGHLDAALTALTEIEARAAARGLTLAPMRASDVAMIRGVLETASGEDDPGPLVENLCREADGLIAAFNEMRESEGAAIKAVLIAQLAQIEELTAEAKAHAAARAPDMALALQRALSRLTANADGLDEGRIAQELALLSVKSDVTEEIDRLAAHITAARDLLEQGGPVGRKLDFLMQEFNREANTLCAKAQNSELTRCGLALKAVIDQMREQVQNVE